MYRKIALLIFYLIPIFSLAQKKKKLSPFFKAVEIKSNDLKFVENLDQARLFFLQKQWDSTLIYAANQINKQVLDKRKNNYAHFFKGYSLYKKKLFKQANSEFEKVSETFDFYERVFLYKGKIRLEQRKFKEAILNYRNALEAIEKYALVGVKKATIENNIGLCYLHLKQFDKADVYLSKSIETVEKKGDTVKLISSYGNLATMYYDQYIDHKAIPYFKKAYVLSKKVDNYELKKKAANNMSIVEENRKNYLKALTYRKESQQWKDSLNNQYRIYETAQLEKKIAVEQKQNEVNLLQAENRIKEAQKNGFLYSAIILLLLFGTTYYFYKGKVKTNKIISTQKENLDELNNTKDKLFSIVSHDLRSSVNAIKSSNAKLLENLETGSKEELSEMLQKNSAIVNGAYGLLDNLLHWSLLQTKQSYFELAQLRLFIITEHVAYNYKPLMLDKKIVFENSIDKKEQVFADQESLKIILRNLLDNAIKFTQANGIIKMYIQNLEEKYVTFVIEDSGIGIDIITQQELLKTTQLLSKKQHEDIVGTGLGLHLVKSMIQKNKGKFAIESTLDKGTKMIVSLPKKM
jgi:signal transduction histidine kinase